MIEQELSDRFHAAVADEPPLGFNPDEVVDRAARMRRRRTATLGAATAAVAVVLGTVTVLQVVRAGDSPLLGGGGAPTSKPADPCAPSGTKTSEPTGTKTKPSSEPTKTKLSEPTGTKSSEPKPPSGTKTLEPDPTKSEPKPPPSCAKPKDPSGDGAAFTGWQDAADRITKAAPQVLAERAPGVRFDRVFPWAPTPDRRCLATAYQINGDGYSAISIMVCHEQKTGLPSSPGAIAGASDWGSPVSDTTGQDGSHVRVYKFDAGGDAGGLSVLHARTDGVVVQVDTGFKAVHGQRGPVLSQERLTAIATDGRLTF